MQQQSVVNELVSSAYIKAKFNGISEATLYRWVKGNKLPEPTRIGRRMFWNKDEIDQIGAAQS